MTQADTDPDDAKVMAAVGDELRRARVAADLSREELIELLPFDLHTRTLASFESGHRKLAVPKLVTFCRVLGVRPSDVLACALQRAQVDLDTNGLDVDLQAVIRDRTPGLAPLRRWATNRLATDREGRGVAHVDMAGIAEMAPFCALTQTELAQYLVSKTPAPTYGIDRGI